jgi:hypothetical protein
MADKCQPGKGKHREEPGLQCQESFTEDKDKILVLITKVCSEQREFAQKTGHESEEDSVIEAINSTGCLVVVHD